MTNQAQIPEVTRSKHCQDVMVNGHRFSISIVYSGAHSGWCLEVIDEHSMAHGWAAVFETECEALEAATIAFHDEGAAGFLQT
tara:strand:- start:148 stop:396 length:249 start_codon:yes stop_codon:yes gene_type:complete